MQSLKRLAKTKTFWWHICLGVICLWFISFRWLVIQTDSVHYHANFQIYIFGQPQALDSDTYYEEISVCGGGYKSRPSARTHLHNHEAHLIHVHDQATTYGHLFSNLGFNLSDNILQMSTETYIDGQTGRLRFMLNGQRVRFIATRVIASQDVLLVDFSNDNLDILHRRQANILPTAQLANTKQDPQSCQGNNQPESLWSHLKKALGF